MAYTKQTWATGDKITAEKLNNIEDGVASSLRVYYLQDTIEVVDAEEENLPDWYDPGEYEQHTLNKTWSELKTMLENGIIPVLFTLLPHDSSVNEVPCFICFTSTVCEPSNDVDYFNVYTLNGNHYSTDSPNGYPKYYYEIPGSDSYPEPQ